MRTRVEILEPSQQSEHTLFVLAAWICWIVSSKCMKNAPTVSPHPFSSQWALMSFNIVLLFLGIFMHFPLILFEHIALVHADSLSAVLVVVDIES